MKANYLVWSLSINHLPVVINVLLLFGSLEASVTGEGYSSYYQMYGPYIKYLHMHNAVRCTYNYKYILIFVPIIHTGSPHLSFH